MKIQQIRNATLKITYARTVFLLDPWLQDKGTGPAFRAIHQEFVGKRSPISDVKSVCEAAPQATIIATHLDSVNHAALTSDDVRDFAAQNNLNQIVVPKSGKVIIL